MSVEQKSDVPNIKFGTSLKGNPTHTHSLGMFKYRNAKCSQKKFMLPNIKALKRNFDSHLSHL